MKHGGKGSIHGVCGLMLAIALGIALPAGSLRAQNEAMLANANTFYARCNAPANTFWSALCVGYLLGLSDSLVAFNMTDGTSKTCIALSPGETTYKEWGDLFIIYLQRKPAARNRPTAQLFHEAMLEAFPCGR